MRIPDANAWSTAALAGAARVLAWVPGGNRADPPRNIVVVRLGNLGDIVVTLPVFHGLRRRFPEANMTLLTSPTRRGAPGAEEVLEQDDTFDDMIVYYEDESVDPAFLRRLRRAVLAREADLGLIIPGDRSRFANLAKHFALLSSCGVRRIAGMRLIAPKDRQVNQVPFLMEQVAELGVAEIEPFPWIHITDDERDYARVQTGNTGAVSALRPVAGIQVGAKRQTNRWPAERFVDVGRALAAEYGARVVLTGSPPEREAAEDVRAAIAGDAINLAGETNVVQLAAVAEQCDVFVSNDTGTMHVAAAMGTPVVAVFSARDYPLRWHPYGEQHTVLRTEIECGPCFAEVCPYYDLPKCLDAISVEQVLEAVRAKLQSD